VLQALFATYTKKVSKSTHFVYTANGGNAGVKDVQNGTSRVRWPCPHALPSDAGTTYVKLYPRRPAAWTVNKGNKLSDISVQQTHDIYRGLLTNWNQIPGSGLENHDRPGRPRHQRRDLQLLPQAVLQHEAPASNVHALTADGPGRQRRQAGHQRDRLRRLAWQGSKKLKTLKVNGIPCQANKISVEPLKYPLSRYIFIVPADRQPEPGGAEIHRLARRSPLAGEVISKAGRVPAFNKK